MEILKYNEKEETLFVQFNTKYIWKYKPVTEEMFRMLQVCRACDKNKAFSYMVRNSFLVGTIKEVNNDFSS